MNTRGAWFRRDIPVIIWLSAAVVIALIHPFFDASRWLMVHLVALGGFTRSIMVWSVHFPDALLKTKQVETRLPQNIRLGLLQLGMLAVFIGVPTNKAEAFSSVELCVSHSLIGSPLSTRVMV